MTFSPEDIGTEILGYDTRYVTKTSWAIRSGSGQEEPFV